MLRRSAQWPFWLRSVAKAVLFSVFLGVVLFPNPYYLAKQVRHLSDTESLIQPDAPFIAGINRDIDHSLPPNFTRAHELKAVESYVYKAIPYAYDWNLWNNVDYWPTATEVWERRQEDCDGRAVLSASILRARGFKDAKIVGNISHVWVEAGGKGLMGAEQDKNFTRENGRLVIKLPKRETLLEGLDQVRHFPAWRLSVLVFAAVALTLHPQWSWPAFATASSVGLSGLGTLYFWASRAEHGRGAEGLFWLSGALFVAALLVALLWPRIRRATGGAARTTPDATPAGA